MFKFYNFIIYIFLFISNASLAEDNFNVVTTKLKKGYTFTDINDLLIKHNFKQIYKTKMPFRKTFEYIYINKKFS